MLLKLINYQAHISLKCDTDGGLGGQIRSRNSGQGDFFPRIYTNTHTRRVLMSSTSIDYPAV